jgi:hypothetical protein
MRVFFFASAFLVLALQPAQAEIDLEKLQPRPVEKHLRELAEDGNTALIAGQTNNNNHVVYIYTQGKNGIWTQQEKLLSPDGANSFFGISGDLSGGTALIGEQQKLKKNGDAAYIFVRQRDGTWIQQAKLQFPSEKRIGWSVSLAGNTALIGTAHPFRGAYVFVRQQDGTWTQQAELQPPADDTDSSFGNHVDLSGDIALIGSEKNFLPDMAGAAYVFARQQDGTWKLQAKLQPPPEDSHYGFGHFVSLSGNTALISVATFQSMFGNAYIFARQEDGTWIQQAKLGKLLPLDNLPYAFGTKVSMKDSATAMVWGNSGSILYIFVRQQDGTWKLRETK